MVVSSALLCFLRGACKYACVQEIASEKAGIFKHGTPAFTIPQEDEALQALQVRQPWYQYT